MNMKDSKRMLNIGKKVLAVCIGFASMSAFAQRKITVGPDVNMNIMILPKNDFSNTILLSPRFGVKGEFYFNPKFSLGTGFYYTERKFQYHSEYTEPTPSLNAILSLLDNIPDMPFDISNALNTDSKVVANGVISEHLIEIPLIASYHIDGITLFGGGYVGFLTSVKNKQVLETTIPFVETVDYKEIAGATLGTILSRLSPQAYSKDITTTHDKKGFNTSDLGLTAGVGYQFKNLNFNVSYAQGFKDYRIDKGDNPKEVSRVVRLSVAYTFNFNIKSVVN